MQSTEPEIWKPVVGYEGYYEVSDLGRVRSLDRPAGTRKYARARTGRVLKPQPRRGGYWYTVCLCVDGVVKYRRVHHLVLEAFVGPRTDGLEGCHNDGDPSNNRPSNLRWDTHRENVLDQLRHGTHVMTNRTHCPHGHEYADWNLVGRSLRLGARRCLACTRGRGRAAHYGDASHVAYSHEAYAQLLIENS